MKLKIDQIVNITINEREEKIPIMQARILGRVSFGFFRKYLIESNTRFWLKQEKDQWSLWALQKEEKEIIPSEDDNGKTEKTNGHPLYWMITDIFGKGKNKKIITERGTAVAKNIDGDVEKIRMGTEMEYVRGKFHNQPNHQWPLFSLEIWKYLGLEWEKQYYSGIKVNVAIAK